MGIPVGGVFVGERERKIMQLRNSGPIPAHVGIIMDGNGRWAQQKGLTRSAGHQAGSEAVRDVVDASSRLGVEVLTLFAFSTENWKRPREEVEFLWSLLVQYLQGEMKQLVDNDIQLRVIGNQEALPAKARGEVARALALTRSNQGLKLIFALNYGGRQEIVDAAKGVARDIIGGRLRIESLDEDTFEGYLYTAGLPDPDLVIRASGELRLSNFLLWQAAYAEFWFSNVLWPDFKPEHLFEAITDFQSRQRRFGGLDRDLGPGGGEGCS